MTTKNQLILPCLLGMAVLSAGHVHAQSTVAELTAQGGAQVSKDDFLAMMPMRIQTQWPNRQGEEELFFTADNKITGKGYHYGSRSESPASGNWKVEDDGKVCTPKTFTAWNSSTNLCWYFFKLGESFFATQNPEPGSRIGKVNAMGKVASAQ